MGLFDKLKKLVSDDSADAGAIVKSSHLYAAKY